MSLATLLVPQLAVPHLPSLATVLGYLKPAIRFLLPYVPHLRIFLPYLFFAYFLTSILPAFIQYCWESLLIATLDPPDFTAATIVRTAVNRLTVAVFSVITLSRIFLYDIYVTIVFHHLPYLQTQLFSLCAYFHQLFIAILLSFYRLAVPRTVHNWVQPYAQLILLFLTPYLLILTRFFMFYLSPYYDFYLQSIQNILNRFVLTDYPPYYSRFLFLLLLFSCGFYIYVFHKNNRNHFIFDCSCFNNYLFLVCIHISNICVPSFLPFCFCHTSNSFVLSS